MAVRNGQFQLIGDTSQQTLSKRGVGIPSPSADPKSGEWQNIGTQVDMGRNSIPSPSADPKSGEFQKVGDEISMSKSPVNNAWGSAYRTPMSREVSWSHASTAHSPKHRKKHGRSYGS